MNKSALNRFIAIAVLLVVTIAAMLLAKSRITVPSPEQSKTDITDTNSDTSAPVVDTDIPDTETADTQVNDDPSENDFVLKETEPAPIEYINKIVFIGDRTIGNISNCPMPDLPYIGQQIWSFDENTSVSRAAQLNDSDTFRHPTTKEDLTFVTGVQRYKPDYVILTFGSYTDGNAAEYSRESFITAYNELIAHLKNASPNTQFIVQSILPVGKGCSVISAEQIKERNGWLKEYCAQNHIYYLDSFSALSDNDGYLRYDLYDPDNINDSIPNYMMNYMGYDKLIYYIRTHVHPTYVPVLPETTEETEPTFIP